MSEDLNQRFSLLRLRMDLINVVIQVVPRDKNVIEVYIVTTEGDVCIDFITDEFRLIEKPLSILNYMSYI